MDLHPLSLHVALPIVPYCVPLGKSFERTPRAMCGLVGIFDSRGHRPIDQGLLAAMTDSLAHRGPDGRGQYVAEGIGLGHRRLSIIDLRSEEHTSDLQSLLSISYAVFCLNNNN